MSREVFKKNDIKTLLASSKSDTAAKFLTFNNNVTDMFGQVNDILIALQNRVTALENNSGIFYLDENGYVCQRITEEEEEETNE